jgi:hypothetical protein
MLRTTILDRAVAVGDRTVTMRSVIGLAAGFLLQIDNEICEVQASYAIDDAVVTVHRGMETTADTYSRRAKAW